MIRRAPTRFGLTLIELMLALAVTAMVGAAIAALLGAVSAGVDTKRDARSQIVRANAAQTRLNAYIVPSRAILSASNAAIVLWFNDARQSETVHASEIRWLLYDADAKTINVYFVKFPDSWNTKQKVINDWEYRKDTNWMNVYNTYASAGYMASITLVDGVTAMEVSTDETAALDSRQVIMRLTLEGTGEEAISMVAATLLWHRPPAQ